MQIGKGGRKGIRKKVGGKKNKLNNNENAELGPQQDSLQLCVNIKIFCPNVCLIYLCVIFSICHY